MLTGAYVPALARSAGMSRAIAFRHAGLAFTVNPAGEHYAGDLPEAEVIRRLATAAGSLGSSADYLFRTVRQSPPLRRRGRRSGASCQPRSGRSRRSGRSGTAARRADGRRRHDRCQSGNLRYHHHRGGFGRLRAGQPPLRRSRPSRAAVGGRAARTTGSGSTYPWGTSSPSTTRGRTGCSARRAVPRPRRPHPRLSAWAGDRRQLGHQRHDLHARAGRRL